MLSGGTSTSVFSYKISSATEFDKFGWKLSNFDATLNSYIPFGTNSAFNILLQTTTQYGRRNAPLLKDFYPISEIFMSGFSYDLSYYLYNFDAFGINYTYLKYASPSVHSLYGIVLGSYIYQVYNLSSRFEAGFQITAYFPGFNVNAKKLNEIEYNFPAKLSVFLFPSSYSSIFAYSTALFFPQNSILNSLPILSYTLEAVLFSIQIQKALPFLPPLFANTFSLYLTSYGIVYDSYAENTSFHLTKLPQYFSDWNAAEQNYFVGLRAECVFSPNIGQTTNLDVKYAFFTEADVQFYASGESIPYMISLGFSSKW